MVVMETCFLYFVPLLGVGIKLKTFLRTSKRIPDGYGGEVK